MRSPIVGTTRSCTTGRRHARDGPDRPSARAAYSPASRISFAIVALVRATHPEVGYKREGHHDVSQAENFAFGGSLRHR
jgi:hypothetical protein